MVLLAVAKHNNLDIDFIDTNPDNPLSTEYLKLNPLKRVPTFQAPDGWVLTEAIAIALYFTSQDKQTTLLGNTERDYAEIIRWMSFVNSEIQPSQANWFKPLLGRREYNEARVNQARDTTNEAIAVLERQLHVTGTRYLIGENITLADLFATSSLSRGFMYVFDREWQGNYPAVTRWFRNLVDQPIWTAVVPDPIIIEEAVKYNPENEYKSKN